MTRSDHMLLHPFNNCQVMIHKLDLDLLDAAATPKNFKASPVPAKHPPGSRPWPHRYLLRCGRPVPCGFMREILRGSMMHARVCERHYVGQDFGLKLFITSTGLPALLRILTGVTMLMAITRANFAPGGGTTQPQRACAVIPWSGSPDMYPGLFNSSYTPSPFELAYIGDPVNLLGPWFCASVFSLLLTGVILAQTYNYVEERPKDPLLVQVLIYFSFVLSVAKSASTLSITWRMFIKDFGDFLKVGTPSADQKITTVWGSFMGLMVQAYFIHRGFILSRNWYFLVSASLAALIGFVGSIIFCVMVFTLNGIPPPLYLQSANMMIIGTVIADALITGFTCWYLLNQRKQSTFTSTNTLIVRLITTSMQSAVPPLICAICNLIFNSRSNATDNAWVLTFNILLPYFYVISLMFTINSRTRLRTGGASQSDGGANVYGLRSMPKSRAPEAPHAGTQVYVTTQTRTDQINSAERGQNPDRRSIDDSSSHISASDKKRRLGDDF